MIQPPNAILKTNQNQNKNMDIAIYATRFSNEKQRGNTSTEVQEKYILECCKNLKLPIIGHRNWEAVSAKTGNEKRLFELISFCKEFKGKANTLVVYKIDRFARDVSEHYYLKRELIKLGFKIKSATEPIDDTPTGKFLETILAGVAQFDNEDRKRKVKLAMQQKLLEGIYPWKVPTGYLNQHDKTGRADVGIIDKLCFSEIKEVFKKFLTGNFTINSLSKEFENKIVYDNKGKKIRFYPQFIQKILNTKYYAGMLVAPEWCEEKEYKGKHEAMISLMEYNKCQEIMSKGKLKGIKHVCENDDFPIRDRLYCGICGSRMTGAWCGHKEKPSPLYYCHNSKCPTTQKKSIQKKDLEIEFQKFISTLKVKDEYIEKLKKKLIERYEARKTEFENGTSKTIEIFEALKLKKQRIMSMMENETYSEEDGKIRLEKVNSEIDEVKLHLTGCIGEEFKIEYLIEHAKRILLTLKDFWDSADYSTKLKIQRKFFPENIIYSFPGFSNTKLSPILESLEVIATENKNMLPCMDSNHNTQLQRLMSYH